jgi:hypothetical protein
LETEQLLAEADRKMYAAKQFHYEHLELKLSNGALQLGSVTVN